MINNACQWKQKSYFWLLFSVEVYITTTKRLKTDQVDMEFDCYCYEKLRKDLFWSKLVITFYRLIVTWAKSAKFVAFLEIACLGTVTSIAWSEELMFGQTWPLESNKSIALAPRCSVGSMAARAQKICLSSPLNRDPLAMRHTGKPSSKSKQAGSILFARYSSQLARSFYYT